MFRRDLLKSLAFIPFLNKLCLGENVQDEVNKIGKPTKAQVIQSGRITTSQVDRGQKILPNQLCYWDKDGLVTNQPTDHVIGIFVSGRDEKGYCDILLT